MERRLAVVTFTRLEDNKVLPKRSRDLAWERLVRVLSQHQVRPHKDGWLWSPVRYREGARIRCDRDVAWIDCLVLDFDSGDGPEAYEERFRPYTHLTHSTHNHRPDAPRWRAVFPLAQTVAADRWKETVWPKLTAVLTDGRIDANCKDRSRMYYIPSRPPASEGHFARAVQGTWLDEAAFPDPPPREAILLPATPRAVLPYGSDNRVDPERILDLAFAEARDKGRNAGALMLFTQLRDNGYTPHESWLIGLHSYLPRLWSTDTRGKEEPWNEGRLQAVWSYTYTEPARQPWQVFPAILPPASRAALPSKTAVNGSKTPVTPPDPEKRPDLLPQGETAQKSNSAASQSDAPDPLTALYTARALQEEALAAPGFVADPLLPEGLVILHGHSKIGKSFCGLSIAVAVACGARVFGIYPSRAGSVLYVAREDGPRRVRHRLSQLLGGEAGWPERLAFAHDWPTMDARGLAALARWLEESEDASLVILDPWTALRPMQNERDIVLADRRPLEHLDALAHRHQMTVLVIHHSSLRGTGDAVNDASGTSGVVQPASAVYQFLAARGEGTGEIKGAAKDAPDLSLSLCRDRRTGFWHAEGGPRPSGNGAPENDAGRWGDDAF